MWPRTNASVRWMEATSFVAIFWNQVWMWICTNGSTSIQPTEAFFPPVNKKKSLDKQRRHCPPCARKCGSNTGIRFGRLQADMQHRTADVSASGDTQKYNRGAHVPPPNAVPTGNIGEPCHAANEWSCGVGVGTEHEPRRNADQTESLSRVHGRCHVRSGSGHIHCESSGKGGVDSTMAVTHGHHADVGAEVTRVHRCPTRRTARPTVHHVPPVHRPEG